LGPLRLLNKEQQIIFGQKNISRSYSDMPKTFFKNKMVSGNPLYNCFGSSGSLKGGYGLDRSGLGEGKGVGTCECGNKPSGSIKCWEFLD
jgi:hypothetical protein